MAELKLNYTKDGVITASYLQDVLNTVANEFEAQLRRVIDIVEDQNKAIQRLSRDVEQERRLRMAVEAQRGRRIRS